MYHHLAHLLSFEAGLTEGMHVKRGDVIGRVGKSGTSSPHLHYEVRKKRPSRWTQYIWGMSKAEVANLYEDPAKYIDEPNNVPAPFDNKTGYQFLDRINSASIGYHPGVDINNGPRTSDLGNVVVSPVDGVISFMGTDSSKAGWGNHLWIKAGS
jgi:murein DD-endopeptidase MepM/ murein hydrolase activator NlpD